MAEIDRDASNRPHTERETVHVIDRSGGTGWWIGGLLVLAVLIIGFIALSGGDPAPVETTTTAPTTETAPAAPAEDTTTAPATGDPAPAETPSETPAAVDEPAAVEAEGAATAPAEPAAGE